VNLAADSILVAGRLFLELALAPARNGSEPRAEWHHAGDGGHLAVAAARLGARVSLLARAGRTPHDDDMLRTLNGEGVSLNGIIRRTTPTATNHVRVARRDQHQPAALSPASVAGLEAADIELADDLLLTHQWLLAEAGLSPPCLERLFESANLCGLHTALCMTYAPEQRLTHDLWDNLHYLILNRSSLTTLARRAHWPDRVLHDPAALCGLLPALRGVVLLNGTSEIMVSDGHDVAQLPLAVRKLVHVRGVGTVTAAAFIVALAEGHAVAAAGRLAYAAVRFYLEHEGTRAAMPFRKELDWRDLAVGAQPALQTASTSTVPASASKRRTTSGAL
jgi:ribokinase